MNPPSKPVVIALAGVAGLVVVLGGILWLRSRSLEDPVAPLDYSLPTDVGSVSTSSPSLADNVSTSTESEPPDGKGGEIPRDADGDGLSDEEEIQAGTNPDLRDSDGDGVNDFEEIRIQHTDPMRASVPIVTPTPPAPVVNSPPPAPVDSDRDGLTDQDEVRYQTNPNEPDTDRDTYPDNEEIQKGYNPRGPGKCATPTCLP